MYLEFVNNRTVLSNFEISEKLLEMDFHDSCILTSSVLETDCRQKLHMHYTKAVKFHGL